jgi:hypothetical protein
MSSRANKPDFPFVKAVSGLAMVVLSALVLMGPRAMAATSPKICKDVMSESRASEKELAEHLREGRVDLETIERWTKEATETGLVGGRVHLGLFLLNLDSRALPEVGRMSLTRNTQALVRRINGGDRAILRKRLSDARQILSGTRTVDLQKQDLFTESLLGHTQDYLKTNIQAIPFRQGANDFLPKPLEASPREINGAATLLRELEAHPAGLAFLREAWSRTDVGVLNLINASLVDKGFMFKTRRATALSLAAAFNALPIAAGIFIDPNFYVATVVTGVASAMVVQLAGLNGGLQSSNVARRRPGLYILQAFNRFAQKSRANRLAKDMNQINEDLAQEAKQIELNGEVDPASIVRIPARLPNVLSLDIVIDHTEKFINTSSRAFDQVAEFFEQAGTISDAMSSFVKDATATSNQLTSQQARERAGEIIPKIKGLLNGADKAGALLNPLAKKVDEVVDNLREVRTTQMDEAIVRQISSSLESMTYMQTVIRATQARLKDVTLALVSNNEALGKVRIALSVQRLGEVTGSEQFAGLLASTRAIQTVVDGPSENTNP